MATQIALVVFGILGTGISIYQASTARASADAAKSAANTAGDTLKANAKDFYIEQRAYVTADGLDFVTIADNKQVLHLVFRDSGRTPAVNFQLSPDTIASIEDAPPFTVTIGEPLSGSVVASDKTQSFDFPYTINEPWKTSFEKKDKKFVMRGSVSYDDVFGCKHQTQFCFAYRKSWPTPKWCSKLDGVNEIDRNSCENVVGHN